MQTHERWHAFRCESCHAGPTADPKNYAPHYSAMASDYLKNDPIARNCSSCHHEHRGRDSAIAHVADADCVRCHRDLNRLHVKDPPPEARVPVANITAFHKDHPEFRLLSTGRPPKRGLTFNHALHLAYGIRPTPPAGDGAGNPNALFRLDNVDLRFREQYRKFTHGDGNNGSPAIKLDFAACHQLDAESSSASVGELPSGLALPARPLGAYYLPITFDQHCQACHSLNVSGLVTVAGLKVTGFAIPHRLQPARVEQFIRGEIIRQVAAQKSILLETPLPPNDRLDAPPSRSRVAIPANLRAETETLVALYNGLLYGLPEGKPAGQQLALKGGYACLKCHTGQGTNDTGRPTSISPTRLRTIWLPNGRFDHSAHRMVQCAQCHANMWDKPEAAHRMTPDWPGESANIPSVRTCQRCHAPARIENGQRVGGVRQACVDCHRYHDADHPLQGRGASLRDLPEDRRFDIESFLKGTPRRSR